MANGWNRIWLIAALTALVAEPVIAQMSVPGWGGFGRTRQHFSNRAAARAALPKPDPTPQRQQPAPARSTSFTPQAAELAPALMANEGGNYSRAERDRLRQQFSEFLATYRERLREAGGPQNDVARAAAWLAQTSHNAYFGGEPMPQTQFDALRRQFEREFAASADFQRKSDRDRQVEFEIYAILGSVVAVMDYNLRQTPNAADTAQMKKLARESFTGLMGVPPERVRLTAAGYEIVAR